MLTRRIRLSPQEEIIVREILQTHLPDREVWVFGSRIGDHPKPYSDLDLLIQGDASLPTGTLSAIKDAFEESNLPFQVDIVEWAGCSEKFRRIMAADYLVIQTGRH
jgi:predicted nucleotidyltransferase